MIDQGSKNKYLISEELAKYKNKKRMASQDFFSASPDFDSSQEDYGSQTLKPRRFFFFSIILFTGLTLLLLRIAYLQIINGEYYRTLAEGNRLRTQYTTAPRGLVYDRRKNLLVRNLPRYSLAIVPADLPKDQNQKQQMINSIAITIGVSAQDISDDLKDVPSYSYQAIDIKTDLDYEEALKLQIASANLKGIVLSNSPKRSYIGDLTLSPILGYVGKINRDELKRYPNQYLFNDVIGKTGLEQYYEQELRGQYGERQVEVDALGKEKRLIKDDPGHPGKNLLLTLDLEMQKVAANALNREMQKIGKTRGAVVVLNPQTGEILSLVSLPTYDDNDFVGGIKSEQYQKLLNDKDKPLYFRAIAGEYPSGSTIKPVIAAAALQENLITPQTSFLSVGGIHLGSFTFPDWKAGGHGLTNVYKAIAESVNTFFYIVGGGYNGFTGLGPDRIATYEKLFGFGQETGVDLNGERDGFVPTPAWKKAAKKEDWYIGDTYHVAIGQGDFLVTPLQLANALTVFANRGTLYRPFLTKYILSETNDIIKEFKPQIIRQNFLRSEVIETVRQGMRQTITNGVAKQLQKIPVAIAGKTGTAQTGIGANTHAWFAGFAPYDNPEILILVLIEDGGEGSSHAVPVAGEIFKWWAENRYQK